MNTRKTMTITNPWTGYEVQIALAEMRAQLRGFLSPHDLAEFYRSAEYRAEFKARYSGQHGAISAYYFS